MASLILSKVRSKRSAATGSCASFCRNRERDEIDAILAEEGVPTYADAPQAV